MKIKVGQVQINNSFSGQNYFPYSVGLLQAYAEKNLSDPSIFEFLSPIYSRVKINIAVEKLMNADIVLFSLYVWNYKLSMEIAKKLKSIRSDVIIVAGGPQVPNNGTEEFLKQNYFLDFVCHGEGERVICPILENFQDRGTWKNIPSISYMQEGSYIKNAPAERIQALDEIPSPYLGGVFEKLIEENPNERWLVMWETNRGCPYSCAFCDWGSATASKVYKFDLERLFREVDWFKEKKIEFIFCCDANFGAFNRDLDIVNYVSSTKKDYGYPHALSVQNTKNAKEKTFQIQKALSDAGLNKGVTLSLQSVDAETLKNIKRSNIRTNVYQDLQTKFTAENIETYTDLILGLPGETYDTFVDGISNVIEAGQHNRIQFNNLSILPNAEMGNPEYIKRHKMEVIDSRIINIHGSLLETEEVYEIQQLIVATETTPREDWVKTRAYCWLTALMHFDKLLQIPFIVLHKLTGLKYREIIDLFKFHENNDYPVISEINQFFLKEAQSIQNGGPEYCISQEWLNIYWPADELMFIKLSTENKLDAFYLEVENIIKNYLTDNFIDVSFTIIKEAIFFNRSLLKQPLVYDDLKLTLKYNIWEFYRACLIGEDIPIEEIECKYIIDRSSHSWNDWQQWCKEVVWYGNKKGAYLYKPIKDSFLDEEVLEPELEGHY